MSNSPDSKIEPFSSESFSSVEAMIRSAGRYVLPSDDLRPKTMEAARDRCSDRKSEGNIWKLAAAMVLAFVIAVPVLERLERWQNQLESPSAAELNDRALKLSHDKGIGPNWGLLEVFSELRNAQSARLGHSPTQNIAQ